MLVNKTIGIGVALILLGLIGYSATGAASVTALIPAFFGVVLGALGWLSRDDKRRKLVMHIAVVVGLLGFAGSVSGIPKLMRMVGGAEIARPAAAISQSIMAVLTGVFVALCVKSFIDARRNPPAA
jgi:hypothetical protein